MDTASLVVIVITFVLFALAVFEKGMTHDLLLEAGVFLVSVKLILMNVKATTAAKDTHAKLDALKAQLDRLTPR